MNARDIQNRGAATTISKRASAGASSEGLGGLRGFLTRYHAGNISAAGGIGNRCRAAPDAFRPWASYTGLLAGCGCGAPASFLPRPPRSYASASGLGGKPDWV